MNTPQINKTMLQNIFIKPRKGSTGQRVSKLNYTNWIYSKGYFKLKLCQNYSNQASDF